MKNQKGITLTSLIITVIVMVMIVGIVLLISVGEEGIIERANEAKRQAELSELKEKIGLEYVGLKNNEANKDKTTLELFTMLDEKMDLDEEHIGDECMIIKLDQDRVITLLEDGTIIEGRIAILNIADGNIVLRPDGFYQTVNTIVRDERWYNTEVTNTKNYTIKFEEADITSYLITGHSEDNIVVVYGEGEFDITIRNLSIDNTKRNYMPPLNLNGATKTKNLKVKLNIEGDNYFYGGSSAPGIGFSKGELGIDGSSLEINGTGSLYSKGGNFAAGIGSGYGYSITAGDVNNITINSGNITAQAGSNGCGIGSGWNSGANNITINGGNITAITGNRYGIGGITGIQKLTINGGNVTAKGGEYGGAIGGKSCSGIVINGGNINLENNSNYSGDDATLGNGCSSVKITGGNIRSSSKMGMGIGNYSTLPFKLDLQGGTVNIEDRISSTPINLSKGNYYLAKIKIGELAKETQITKVELSNSIEYEANNLYTTKDGHLFMLLPQGEVTISVTANKVTYTGTVTVTSENTAIFKLN